MIRSVVKELKSIVNESLEGIKVIFNDEDVTDIQAIIDGPSDTPYQGGSFRVRCVLGKQFPSQPPSCYFLTKIFHPNVSSRNGEICVNTLKKDWKPDLGIKHILLVSGAMSIAIVCDCSQLFTIFHNPLQSSAILCNSLQSSAILSNPLCDSNLSDLPTQTIKCLLIVPNPESALNEDAGKLLLDHYEDYCKRARMMTEIHAIVNTKATSTKAASAGTEKCQSTTTSSSAPTSTITVSKKGKTKILKDKKRTLKRL